MAEDLRNIIGRNDINIPLANLERTAQQLRTKLVRQMDAVKSTKDYLDLVDTAIRQLQTAAKPTVK